MQTIWKFHISFINGACKIQMPFNSKILKVESQGNIPMMWAMVNSENTVEERLFEVYGTGHELQQLSRNIVRKYIGTFQCDDGDYVFHVFELI